MGELICCLGCGKESSFVGKNGKHYCNSSPNRCPAKRERDSMKKKGRSPFEGKEHPRGHSGIPAWNRGLTGVQRAWNKGLVRRSKVPSKPFR